MKKILLLLSFLLTVPTFNYATKRALIVAIGNYNMKLTGWPPISSINDIPYIRKVLLQNQFEDIEIIQDEQATRKGIMEAAAKLIQRSKSGDIIALFFSAHGQLLEFKNADGSLSSEETIAAWGAPVSPAYEPGYIGEKHLSHADIRKIRDELRRRIGPNGDLVIFFDACHSGGMVRGRGVRGGPPFLIRNLSGKKIEAFNYFDNEDADSSILTDSLNNMSRYLGITACASDESNLQNLKHHCGSLTYALSVAFHQIKPGDSYKTLFSIISKEVVVNNPSQHPEIFGMEDREIFSGKVKEDPFFLMTDENWKDSTYTINGGEFKGLTKGTILDGYLLKNKNANRPVFKAEIVNTEATTSKIKLLDSLKKNTTRADYLIYIEQINDAGYHFTVSIKNLKNSNPSLFQDITQLFSPGDGIILSENNPDLIVIYDSITRKISLISSEDGRKMNELVSDSNKLKSYIIQYHYYSELKNLVAKDINYVFDMRIGPVNSKHRLPNQMSSDQKAFSDSDNLQYSVKNLEQRSVFFNLLLLRPDGNIGILIKDRIIEAEKIISRNIKKLEPGKYLIMGISTSTELHLESALQKTVGLRTENLGMGTYILKEPFVVLPSK